jgi:hypothetical protein
MKNYLGIDCSVEARPFSFQMASACETLVKEGVGR